MFLEKILHWILLQGCLYGVRSYSSAKYTWPLSYDNPTLQIRDTMETNGERGCAIAEGGIHTSLAYPSTLLQGNADSYIQLTVTEDNTFDEAAISVNVRAYSSSGGTIFHYQQDASGSSAQRITDILLWYNSTNIVLEVYGPAGVSYGILVEDFPFSVIGEWTTFIVIWGKDGKEFKLFNTKELGKMKPDTEPPLGQPGVLRIGSTVSGFSRPFLYGEVTCCNWNDVSKVGPGDVTDLLAECAFSGWESETPPSFPTVDPSFCNSTDGRFTLFQKDVAVGDTIATVANATVRSRVRCADLCHLQAPSKACASFTFNKVTGDCKMYDSNYFGNIVTVDGSLYYTRTVTCCPP